MNIKAIWLDKFQGLLWEHHTCDWKEGNSNPNYPFQLAVAYFDWDYDAWEIVRCLREPQKKLLLNILRAVQYLMWRKENESI